MSVLNDQQQSKLLNIRDASIWASEYLQKPVTTSNITYLVNYGRIRKTTDNGGLQIDVNELKEYYDQIYQSKRHQKNSLEMDINWHLSFDEYQESERTKHVHRLHPYKGKFIPQLVEYFLDSHIDEFKRSVTFSKGDIVLDPFCGSGTTLVQANELGIHAIGIDISSFNSLISNVKIDKHDIPLLTKEIQIITQKLFEFNKTRNIYIFEQELLFQLAKFNNKFFPSPEFRQKVHKKEIDEFTFAKQKVNEFVPVYESLLKKYTIKLQNGSSHGFLDKWYLLPVREEIDFIFDAIKSIQNEDVKKVIAIIFSRTIRSCRATTHADLGTLIDPVNSTYYCKKHGKICKPLFGITKWWGYYSQDTIKRLKTFDGLRSKTVQQCFTGDSRSIDLEKMIQKRVPQLSELFFNKKIRGIFTSPPYLGLIDYHEQHAYAYELFGFPRQDELEIGALSKGQNRDAKENYVNDIAAVLKHCIRYLQPNFDIFIVANDKNNLYPQIAEISELKIVNQFKRPVLNRVEKDRSSYSETIFQMRGQNG